MFSVTDEDMRRRKDGHLDDQIPSDIDNTGSKRKLFLHAVVESVLNEEMEKVKQLYFWSFFWLQQQLETEKLSEDFWKELSAQEISITGAEYLCFAFPKATNKYLNLSGTKWRC